MTGIYQVYTICHIPVHLDSCRRTMSYVRRTTSYNTDVAHDVVRQARTTSYPHDVVRVARTTYYGHSMSMSYVRHVRHCNIRCRSTYDIATIRCRMFIRYRRSDVRHRMLSSYTTSYVLTCISYVHAYNIAYDITYDIVYDIVYDVHSIGFRAGFRGFKLHARLRRHRNLHANVFIQASTAPPAAGGPAPSPPLSAAAAGGSSCSGGRGSRFLVLFILRHGEALGVNGFACGNVHNIPFSTVNIRVLGRHHVFVHVLQLRTVQNVKEYILLHSSEYIVFME